MYQDMTMLEMDARSQKAPLYVSWARDCRRQLLEFARLPF